MDIELTTNANDADQSNSCMSEKISESSLSSLALSLTIDGVCRLINERTAIAVFAPTIARIPFDMLLIVSNPTRIALSSYDWGMVP